MKKYSLLFLLIFCFSLIQLSSAQFQAESFALTGNGARAAGMGYAFTGVADDASAISWNPAGLTQLQSMEASVVGRFGFGSGSVDFPSDEYMIFNASTDYYSYIDLDVLGINSWDIEQGSEFKLNFASFVFPFKMGKNNVVGGIAYRNLYDMSYENTNTIDGNFKTWRYSYTTGNFLGETDNGDVELKSIRTGSGGINAISPSIGFQVNEMFSVGTTINFLTGSVKSEEKTEINDIEVNDDDMKIDFSGTAIDLGVLVKPTPTFSIGANINLPHAITGEIDGEEGDLDIPMFFNIGAGLRATDNLLFAFDYRSRPWSDAEDEDGDPIFDEDANSIHAGLEYLLMAGNNVMPIRLGFYTKPLPEQDANEDQISNNVITAGLGIIMGNIIVDGSFEYEMTEYAADKTFDDNDINYTGSDFRISVGAVIHFDN